MSSVGGRRVLRGLEHAALVFESVVNHLTDSRYNPLYHTGTIAVWLLVIVAASGVLLLLVYFAIYGLVPDAAFASIERLNDFWLGRLARSVHRYAADLTVVVVLLHALRMLVTDRFSGSRWLAWVSGVALLGLVLLIGTFGLWLIGDTRAQVVGLTLTRLLGGPTALTFLTNETARRAFYLFFLILVFHVALGLLVAIFYWVHTLRLSRAKLLPPRFWVYSVLAVLIAVVVMRPAFLAAPADLGRLPAEVPLDPFFLLFLPAAQDWGVPLFVGVNLVGWGLAALWPWLYPRRQAKAVIIPSACTGCALCANDCPYAAIEMRSRRDERPYKLEGVVEPARCVACGICLGACSWDAIRLGGQPHRVAPTLRERLAGHSRVVFACERHAALGALRGLAPIASAGEQGGRGAGKQRLALSGVEGSGGAREQGGGGEALFLTVPCAGAIHPDLILHAQQFGADQVVIVSCLEEDCSNREGSEWLAARLEGTRPPFLAKEVDPSRLRAVWVAPNDARGLKSQVTGLKSQVTTGDPRPFDSPSTRLRTRLRAGSAINDLWDGVRRARFLPGLVLLATLFVGVVWGADVLYRPYPPGLGQLKVALAYGGQFREAARPLAPQQMSRLPPGVRAEDVLGVPRFPIYLELDVDGEPRARQTYLPSGLRQDGISFALEEIFLPPGDHQVEIRLDDRGEAKPQAMYSGVVTVKPGEVRVLSFDSRQQTFVLK